MARARSRGPARAPAPAPRRRRPNPSPGCRRCPTARQAARWHVPAGRCHVPAGRLGDQPRLVWTLDNSKEDVRFRNQENRLKLIEGDMGPDRRRERRHEHRPPQARVLMHATTDSDENRVSILTGVSILTAVSCGPLPEGPRRRPRVRVLGLRSLTVEAVPERPVAADASPPRWPVVSAAGPSAATPTPSRASASAACSGRPNGRFVGSLLWRRRVASGSVNPRTA